MVGKFNPGALLEQALEKAGIGPTALAKKLGVDYQTVYRWTTGRGFRPANQLRCIEALRLPDDYFTDHAAAAERERDRQAAFESWTQRSAYAQTATLRELRFLKRLLPDDPDFRPTESWYDVQLGLLRNVLMTFDPDAVLAKNRAIAAEIDAEDAAARKGKPGPKRRRRTSR